MACPHLGETPRERDKNKNTIENIKKNKIYEENQNKNTTEE